MTVSQPISQKQTITKLPNGVLSNIFTYFDIEDIQAVKKVNTAFQSFAAVCCLDLPRQDHFDHSVYPLMKIAGWGEHDALNPLISFQKEENASIVSLSYSKDNKLLHATSSNFVKVLTVANQELNFARITGLGQLLKANFSSDGNKIVCILNPLRHPVFGASVSAKVIVADVNQTTNPPLISNLCDEPIMISALSADNVLLALGLQNEMQIWDLTTGLKTQSIQTQTTVSSLAFESFNRLVFGESKDLKVWNLSKNMLVRSQTAHTDTINCLSVHAPTGLAATGSSDADVKIWDLKKIHFEPVNPFSDPEETQKDCCKFSLSGHRDEIQALEFSSSGRLLASGSLDRKILIWDILKGTLKQSISQYGAKNGSISWSPCQTKLASTGFNGTLNVWIMYPNTQDYILAWLNNKIPKHQLPKDVKLLPDQELIELASSTIIESVSANFANLSYSNFENLSSSDIDSYREKFMHQTLEEIQSYPEALKDKVLTPILALFEKPANNY